MERLLKVLQILLSYKTEENSNTPWMISAEHDEIYMGGPKPISIDDEDLEKLSEYRCRWDEVYESWVIFT